MYEQYRGCCIFSFAGALVTRGFAQGWVLTAQPSVFVDAVLHQQPARDAVSLVPADFRSWQLARQSAGLTLPPHAVVALDVCYRQTAVSETATKIEKLINTGCFFQFIDRTLKKWAFFLKTRFSTNSWSDLKIEKLKNPKTD